MDNLNSKYGYLLKNKTKGLVNYNWYSFYIGLKFRNFITIEIISIKINNIN